MVCPRCHNEYAAETITCPTCQVTLIAKRSKEDPDDEARSAIAVGVFMAVMIGGTMILWLTSSLAVRFIGFVALGIAAMFMRYRYPIWKGWRR